jgi:hypothetical protein
MDSAACLRVKKMNVVIFPRKSAQRLEEKEKRVGERVIEREDKIL